MIISLAHAETKLMCILIGIVLIGLGHSFKYFAI